MNVTVTIDGNETELEVDLSSLTLQEACDVEDALGADRYQQYASGTFTPSIMRAVLWAKLRRHYDVGIDGFDLDLATAFDTAVAEDEPGPFDNPS